MKKSAVRFLIVACLFDVAPCSLFKKNIYVPRSMTWSKAREYCRKYHTDLSSVSNVAEYEELLKNQKHHWKAWIGLYKDADDLWKWPGGENASFFKWSVWGNKDERKKCVVLTLIGWRQTYCHTEQHFHCYTNKLVLMKENKTWEEAMKQCRHQHTDLVSLLSESVLVQTLNTSREAQTDHVWTGLRYLADTWFWVNGDDVKYQVWRRGETPQCSARNHHCGALSLVGQHWESWDCADKLNFICY